MALKKTVIAVCSIALMSIGLANNVSAAQFDGQGLDENGNFHVGMVPPSNESEKYILNELIGELAPEWGVTAGGEWNCNADFTSCKLVYQGTEWTDESYGIIYEYDPVAKEAIDFIVAGFEVPADGFFVNDAELMKYMVFGGDSLAAYSSEVKSAFSNYNLEPKFDARGGEDGPLVSHNIGMEKVYYNGALYKIIGGTPDSDVKVVAPHIFYVPTDSSDYPVALLDRFVEIYGEEARDAVEILATDDKVKDLITADDTFYDYFKDYLEETVFEMNITQGRLGDSFYIVIVADSDKIGVADGVDSTDVLTDINIKAMAENLPGDLVAKAEVIGSDDEGMREDFGDKFMGYEIGLYSPSLDMEVSDNGGEQFEITIPVPEVLRDVQEISAYWKHYETGELEEHPADRVGENVVFRTTHFSTYVLAESRERPAEEDVEPEGESEAEDGAVVPGAPDTGSRISGFSNVAASLPVFGAVFVAASVVAFVLSKRK